ncbi:MAG: type I restriction endonuclease [Sandaracinaceae bacterium]
MSFTDQVRALADRIPNLVAHLETEEATKTALVLPFVAALGYDVFDPTEVVPEFTADVGIKKGEKVDFAIKKDGAVIIVVECKAAGKALDVRHASQLYRYFSVTKARIAMLTNGIEYRFFSDLEETNKMDERPFLVIDLRALREDTLAEARRLTKEHFSLDDMMSAAGELKYLREIRLLLDAQFNDPDEDFVRFFHARVSSGRFTQSSKEQFTDLVKRALATAVRDRVSGRLRSALEVEETKDQQLPAGTSATAETGSDEGAPPSEEGEPDIETTAEELEGFNVVRAIVCNVLRVERVCYRDAKTYFAVLVDNNNRKPICRLWFNSRQKYIGLLDEDKSETRHPIEAPAEIYQFADALRTAAARYSET